MTPRARPTPVAVMNVVANVVVVVVVVVVALVACDRPPPDPTWPPDGMQGRPGDGEEHPAPPDPEPAVSPDEETPASTPPGDRTPMVDADAEMFARLEGTALVNACETDAACFKGGCSGEVCSAEDGVNTTCDVLPVAFPPDAACGCIQGECRWWSPSGGDLRSTVPATTAPETHDGKAGTEPLAVCGGRTCRLGQTCVEYYGIAGDKGPKLHSCEWRCTDGCPEGTTCITIADGPGKVCREP